MLLTHDEVYVEASRLALEAVFGIYAEGPDIPGDTAPAHIRRALRTVGVPEAEIDAGLPRWCETFSDALRSPPRGGRHEPLAARPACRARRPQQLEHRALLTGNPPAVAHARMERLGLAELFPRGQGAFGCERESRVDLFDLARERAGNWPRERTVAVGDTPLDVSSAHAAGSLCIGVTTGSYGPDELADADAVIADLGELKETLAALG